MVTPLVAMVDIRWRSSGELILSWTEGPGARGQAISCETLARLRQLADAVRAAENGRLPAPVETASAALSTALFALLDGTDQALAHRLSAAKARHSRLDLVVRATTSDRRILHSHPACGLRWELLPFSVERDCVLNVVLQLGPRELAPPLFLDGAGVRILFMAFSPRDMSPELDFEQEEEALLTALAPLIDARRARVRVVEGGTLDQLGAALRMEHYDVVHLTGHGFAASYGARLVMEDAFGAAAAVSPGELCDVLEQAGAMPALVMLAACHTAQVAGSGASFAAELVAAGVPSVLGWARPVRDEQATFAASLVYEQLGAGRTPAEAAASAREHLRQSDERSLSPTHAWATLHLVTSSASGFRIKPQAAAVGEHAESDEVYEYLGSRMRVLKTGFVGRRRLVQRLLQVLLRGQDVRPNGTRDVAGACLFGMRGVGKSCTVGRVLERAKQVAPELRIVVLHGTIDERGVLEAFQTVIASSAGDETARELLAFKDQPVVERVRRVMEHWANQQVAVVLDDFEQNLQPATESPWSVHPDAAALLEALLPVCASGQPKLLVTSTAEFLLTEEHAASLAFLPVGSFDSSAVHKLWMRGQASSELASVSLKSWQELADRLGRNARVLAWARALCAGKTDGELSAVAASAAASLPVWRPGDEASDEKQAELARLFLRHIAHEQTCAELGEDALLFVKRARVFEAAVPKAAFVAFVDGLAVDLDRDLDVLASFGVLEVGEMYGDRAYRVSPLIEPRFEMPNAARWHTAAATAWSGLTRSTNTGREDFVPVLAGWEHALQAGDAMLAEDLGGFLRFHLSERGLFASSFRLAERHLTAFPESWFGYCWAGYHGFHAGLSGPRALALYRQGHALLLQARGTEPHVDVEESLFVLGILLADAQGDLAGALAAHERCLALRVARAGTEADRNVASSLVRIGSVLAQLGDLAGARQAAERALAIYAQLGCHGGGASSLLGNVLLQQGDLTRAREVTERDVALMSSLYPADNHPNVAVAWHCLGRVLDAQGDFAGARRAFERSLDIKARLLGTDLHADVAKSLGELGGILKSQGDLAGARSVMARALEISTRVLGTEDHPDVATHWSFLADVSFAQGDFAAARGAVERALDIQARVLGSGDHPQVAVALLTLGRVLEQQGELAEARQAIESALAISIRVFGTEDHPDVAVAFTALACVLLNQGDPTAAHMAIERSLEIGYRLHGTEDHPSVAIDLQVLATALHRMGDLHRARNAAERALAIWARLPDGGTAFETARASHTLGLVLEDQGDRVAARRAFERALAIEVEARGTEDDLHVALQLCNLAVFLSTDGEDHLAQRHLERALAIVLRVAGEEHPLFVRLLSDLGTVQHRLEDFSGARHNLDHALELWPRVLGTEEHDCVARTLHALAAVLLSQHDLAAARSALEAALAIFTKVLGAGDHLPIADSLYGLGCVLEAQRDPAGARAAFSRSIDMQTRLLGRADHPRFAEARRALASLDQRPV